GGEGCLGGENKGFGATGVPTRLRTRKTRNLNERARISSTSLKRQRRFFAGASGLCCIIANGHVGVDTRRGPEFGNPTELLPRLLRIDMDVFDLSAFERGQVPGKYAGGFEGPCVTVLVGLGM